MVGARLFAPSEELVKQYSEAIVSANDPQDRRIQELIYQYILQNLGNWPLVVYICQISENEQS